MSFFLGMDARSKQEKLATEEQEDRSFGIGNFPGYGCLSGKKVFFVSCFLYTDAVFLPRRQPKVILPLLKVTLCREVLGIVYSFRSSAADFLTMS